MSDNYHTPKDLVNRLPLLPEEEDQIIGSNNNNFGCENNNNSLSSSSNNARLASTSSLASLASSGGRTAGELLLELHYSDPRDSKVYSQPGGLGAASLSSSSNKSKVDGENSNLEDGEEEELIYKLYVGGEYYYCRPYRPNYEAVRSKNGIQSKAEKESSVYEDVGEDCNNNNSNNNSNNNCITIISVSPIAANNNSNNSSNNNISGLTTTASSPTPTEADELIMMEEAINSAVVAGGGGANGRNSTGTSTTLGSETSSERGSFTINAVLRQHHPNSCRCNNDSLNDSCKTATKTTTNDRRASITSEPMYENLAFHRVQISIPGHHQSGSRRRMRQQMLMHRAAQDSAAGSVRGGHVSTRVVRGRRVANKKSTASSTVNGQSVTSDAGNSNYDSKKRFSKFGYSNNEVWNWLYTEDEEDSQQGKTSRENGRNSVQGRSLQQNTDYVSAELFRELYSVPSKKETIVDDIIDDEVDEEDEDCSDDKVEVKFSPQEFFDSSNRLAHLDLDGLDDFVGSTLEKAMLRRRKQQKRLSNMMIKKIEEQQQQQQQQQQQENVYVIPGQPEQKESSCNNRVEEEDRTVTITEVPTTSPLNVKATLNTCQTCRTSGESSCSSALSSLESVKNGGSSSGSSNAVSRSSSGSETLASELLQQQQLKQQQQRQQQQQQPPAKPMRNQSYQQQIQQQQQVFRKGDGKQRLFLKSNNNSSLPYPTNSLSSNYSTAYQILEMTAAANNGTLESYNELYEDTSGHKRQQQQQQPRYITMHNSSSSSIKIKPTLIDPTIPLDRQEWFHGAITRVEAESVLRLHGEGSYLVRNSESSRQDFSLSLKSSHGFMHMRIQRDLSGRVILGQFSKPFESVPAMVHHYTLNRLPIRGAEHMSLVRPICEQLL